MTAPSARALLRQLDGLPYPQRSQQLWLIGRREAGSQGLTRLLEELDAGDLHARSLALVIAAAAGNTQRLSAALGHPSPGIRRQALALGRRVKLDDGALERELLSGPADQRHRVAREVRVSNRTELAERVIGQVRRQRGDREASALLAACSPETVAALLPELDHAIGNWASLARRHPDVVLAHMTATLDAARPIVRAALWRRFYPGVRVLAERHPPRVLDLVLRDGPDGDLPFGVVACLGYLTRVEPVRVVELLTSSRYQLALARSGVPGSVVKNLASVPPHLRVRFAAPLVDRPELLADLLKALPPSERAELFAAATAGRSTSETLWPEVLLDTLPRSVRGVEARRMLNLPSVRDSEQAVLLWTSFLPFDEAAGTLGAAIRRSRPEDRAVGYARLIECGIRARDPEVFGEMLSMLDRLTNEQDPVRLAALMALQRTPPSAVTDANVPPLDHLVVSTMEARDTSTASLFALSRLAVRLLRAGSSLFQDARSRFAVSTLDRLAARSGSLSLGPRLSLPKGAETVLLEALDRHLDAAAKREAHELCLEIATALKRRAWGSSTLQRNLERATAAPNDWVARRAVSQWLADPATRSGRVETLLRRDPSVVALAPVITHINHRRQDLLQTVLKGQPIQGRFLSKKTVYVPIFAGGFERWLPAQRRAYRTLLLRIADDPDRPMQRRTQSLRALAALPEGAFASLLPYVDSEEVAIAEAALAGLARTDDPGRALPVLVEHLGTARARVAAYAVDRCARFLAPDELGPALVGLLTREGTKLTARKEAIRLVARHRVPGYVDLLARESSRPDLHLDLRIALGWAARQMLGEPEAWTMLEALAAGGVDGALSLLGGDPLDIPSAVRPRYGRLVMGLGSHPSEQVRSEAFRVLAAWAPDPGEGALPAVRAVADLGSGPSWQDAAAALVALAADAGHLPAVAQLSADLIVGLDADQDADAGRDLPRRQRLLFLTRQILGAGADHQRRMMATVTSVADALIPDPTLLGQELRLRLAAVDWTATAQASSAVLAAAQRCGGRPAEAHALGSWLRDRLMSQTGIIGHEDLVGPAEALAAAPGLEGPILALGLVGAGGPLSGWAPRWREMLRSLRRHPDADLASAARSLVTVPEGLSGIAPGSSGAGGWFGYAPRRRQLPGSMGGLQLGPFWPGGA